MDAIDLKQLAAWLADTDIDRLELRSPGGHVRLRRGGAAGQIEAEATVAATAPASPESRSARQAKAESAGVFLDRHPLRPSPFVQPGDTVVRDQLVGLLQIGALLLPVRAPCDGVAGALCAVPGATVGYGTPLIDILPPAAA